MNLKILFLTVILGAFKNLSAFAYEAPLIQATIDTQAIRIVGLESQAGKALHVLFVSGREPAITTLGSQLQVRTVLRALPKFIIPKDGILEIPKLSIPRSSFTSLNYVVFGITPPSQEQLYLRNVDQSPVEDYRSLLSGQNLAPSEKDFEHEGLYRVSTLKLRKLPTTADQTCILNFKSLMRNPNN